MVSFSDDRVALRPVTAADSERIAGYFDHPEMLGLRQVETDPLAPIGPGAVAAIVDDWVAGTAGLALVVSPAGSDEIVGHLRCDWGWDAMNPWLGVAIASEHRRNGYGSAAADLLLAWLFDQTVAHSVQAWTPSWNDAGVAFLSAMGFAPAGAIRRAWLRDGAWHDDLAFDLLRSEWEAS